MTDPRRIQQLWATTLRGTSFEGIKLDATVKPGAPPTLNQARTAPLARGSGGTVLDRSATSAEIVVPADIQRGMGHYKLIAIVGQGGMGVVYRALQSGLDRPVAVKKIRRARDPKLEADFLRESRITGKLDHPNVVPVFDLGADQQREPMLAMKLIDGVPWSALLHPSNDALSARATTMGLVGQLGVLIQVCNAVAYAHSRGIVHCDLKPENVMVGEFGEVFVMDWGVAIELGQAIEKPGPRGTPVYMAPELVDGRPEAIDARTDVYLLGAILYEILAGEPPHERPSLMEVLLAAVRSEPRPPADAPPELASICRRAIAADPAARFASARDFQAALTAYLEHRESLTISQQARQTLEDCQTLAGRASLKDRERVDLYEGFAEAVAGFRQAHLLWPGNAEAERGEQEARARYAEAALARGDLGLAEAQIARLEPRAPERKPLDKALRQRRRQARAAERRRRLLSYGLLGSLLTLLLALGYGFFYSRQVNALLESKNVAIEDKQAEAERQRDLARERAAELDRAFQLLIEQVRDELRDVSSPEVRAARTAILAEALGVLESLRRRPGAGQEVSAYTVSATRQLAELAASAGDTVRAAEGAEEALDLARALVKREPTSSSFRYELARVLLVAARIRAIQNRKDEALNANREGLALIEALAEARPPIAGRRLVLVELLRRMGNLTENGDERIRLYERSVEEGRSLVSEGGASSRERRELLFSLQTLAGDALTRGAGAEARACYREAMTVIQDIRAAGPLKSADLQVMIRILSGQATLSERAGDLGQAGMLIREAAKAQTELLSRDTNDADLQRGLARALGELGRIQFLQLKPGEAAATFRMSLDLGQKLVARDPNSIADKKLVLNTLGQLGAIAELQRSQLEALQRYQESRDIAAPLLSRFPKDADLRESLVRVLDRMAAIQAQAGRVDQARALLEEALTRQGELVVLDRADAGRREALRGLQARLDALPSSDDR